jgi:hypothetical protein
MLYFALQQMLTHEQLSIFFDDKNQYPARQGKLRSETLAAVQKELSAVIKDNEIKVT